MEARVKTILKEKHEDFFDQETSVGQATNVVRDKFLARDHTATVRRAWKTSSGLDDGACQRLIRQWGTPLQNPIVVLWSRQSGAQGGLHPEHHSSYTGLGDLVRQFHALGTRWFWSATIRAVKLAAA
jgi:hypothetical protein